MRILRWFFAITAVYVSYRTRHFELSMPYPGFGTVQTIPQHKLPRPSELVGQYAPNEVLKGVTKLFEGRLQGTESVQVSKLGTLWLPDKYGNIFTSEPDVNGAYKDLQKVAYVGPSRPLGHVSDAHDNLVICDASKGLVMLEQATGKVVILASQVSDDSPLDPGSVINYANDADIAEDGTIYFTTSSDIPVVPNAFGFWDTYASFTLTMLQGSVTGRLLSYSPKTKKTHVLAGDMFYANGVVVAHDQSFLLVVETMSVTIHKYWLKGPKKGQMEVWISNLPGFPDGISQSEDGNYWVAMAGPNQPFVKALPYRFLRFIFAWLPKLGLRPATKVYGMVIKISPEGKVLDHLMDTDGSVVNFISAVTEHNGRLFFGNVAGDYVSYIDTK
ncbi:TPA: putative alkaloid biosynthetic cluster [Trebouxia sp. C0005]